MSAMQEADIETLTLIKITHFVRDYETGKSGEGQYAYTFCGRWAHESWVKPQKYSAVKEWCRSCYRSRRRWIEQPAALAAEGSGE